MLCWILMMATAVQVPDSKPPTPPERPATSAKQPEVAGATPEEALRSFLLAMGTKDEPTLRVLTLPNDDFDWLLKGQVVPVEQRDEFKVMMTRQPIRTLKPGDEVILPRNRKIKVQASEVTDDRAVLLPEGAPIPTRLRKIDGIWRVDATPIIMGRKAADAARKKSEKPGL